MPCASFVICPLLLHGWQCRCCPVFVVLVVTVIVGEARWSGWLVSDKVVQAYINKSHDWWTCHINFWYCPCKIVENKIQKILLVTWYNIVVKTGPNWSWTGSLIFCKPQDRGPDFSRTGKTVTEVLPGLVTVQFSSQSFFGLSNQTLKHYLFHLSQSLQSRLSQSHTMCRPFSSHSVSFQEEERWFFNAWGTKEGLKWWEDYNSLLYSSYLSQIHS